MHYRPELVFDIGPGKEGGLLEGFAGSYRSQEGLEWAEERLKGDWFHKARGRESGILSERNGWLPSVCRSTP